MTWKIAAVAFVFMMCVVMLVFDARAQRPGTCQPEKAMLDWLARRWSEHPVWIGSGPTGGIIVTRNDRKSWTVLATDGKQACVVRAGTRNRFDVGI